MKEENPYGCRALSSSSRKDSIVQSNSVLSSFVSITFPQPKIRITMPKLLAKTLHRRNLQKCDDTENANDSTTTTTKKKKKNNKWIKPGNLFPKKVGSIVSNVFGNKKSAEKSRKKDGICSEEAEVSKTELEVPLSSPGTSNKRNGNMKGKQASSSNLIRVSSRKIRMARSMRKKAITDRAEEEEEEEEEEEKSGEEELCKKRILMGEKCRPLNACGALHYDENGVLLPEEEYRCDRNLNH